MRKFFNFSLLLLTTCLIFTACKKSGIEQAPPSVKKTSFLSSAENRVAVANAFKTYFGRNNTTSLPASNGAQFIVPFFTDESQGIGKFDPVNFKLELASFTAELTSNDFYRQNPDGTYSVHVNSNNALAEYYQDLFDPAALYLYGDGTHFDVDYTGNLVEFPFYDENGNLISVFRFIDFGGSGRAVSVHGNGNVGPEGTAPWKKLSIKAVVTPGGAKPGRFHTEIIIDIILKSPSLK
jgi:hypothetical protein